jgi:hypothetical protein
MERVVDAEITLRVFAAAENPMLTGSGMDGGQGRAPDGRRAVDGRKGTEGDGRGVGLGDVNEGG